jgi:hypothetical protein
LFGGISVVFFADFLQLAPVILVPLTEQCSQINRAMLKRIGTEIHSVPASMEHLASCVCSILHLTLSQHPSAPMLVFVATSFHFIPSVRYHQSVVFSVVAKYHIVVAPHADNL